MFIVSFSGQKESKISIGVRSIFCILEKAEKVWWTKLLCGDGKTPHYVKVDWDKWVDEDEDNGSKYCDCRYLSAQIELM